MPVIVFAVMYAHIARSLVKSVSAGQSATMTTGVAIIVVTYATAFLGYAMVFGDMGFWATTVIFQLLGFIPGLIESLFGNFALDTGAITKLFTLHYLLGLGVAALMIVHVLVLHTAGSLNPGSTAKEMSFADTLAKDALVVAAAVTILISVLLLSTICFVHGSNDKMVDTAVTPGAVLPEWYLLSVYGGLKSCASKAGGLLVAACLMVMLGMAQRAPGTNMTMS